MEMSRTFSPSEYDFSRENPINRSDTADADISTTTSVPNIRNNHAGLDNPPSVIRYNGSSVHDDQSNLPPGTACSIQMGSKVFRLSGASIMSDTPSYFSKFFEEQYRKQHSNSSEFETLYIDRDSDTFEDICRHLQGYYVQPRDTAHFVRLFVDAHFYGLPRLVSQLYETEIIIEIGGQMFQIPRDLFSSPGNSPNFFSLGFGLFFSTPGDTFPGLDQQGLLRPPSILPPRVHNRSANVFAELLHLLRGYPLPIKDHQHREALLSDCRYYNFRGLEQQLIPHHISYNAAIERSEIIVRLEDIRQSGISMTDDNSVPGPSRGGWVYYGRPFVDDTRFDLILEIGGECTVLDWATMTVDFHGPQKTRFSTLLQVIANKLKLPTRLPLGLMMASGGVTAQPASPGNTPLSEDRVKVLVEPDAHIRLDGADHTIIERANVGSGARDTGSVDVTMASASSVGTSSATTTTPVRKRKRSESPPDLGSWIIKTGQWRLRTRPHSGSMPGSMEIILYAVKLHAISGQRSRNAARGFLGGLKIR